MVDVYVSHFKTAFLSLPGRYASALIKSDAHDHRTSFDTFHEILKHIPSIRKILYGESSKKSKVFTLLDMMNQTLNIPQNFINLIKLLYQEKRFSLFEDIRSHYIELYQAKNNIQCIAITSAATLTQTQKKSIESLKIDILNPNCDLEFSYTTRKNILGGLIVDSDGTRFDASLQTHINQLTNHIKETTYATKSN